MRTRILFILLFSGPIVFAQEHVFFDKMDAFLEKFMTNGEINYAAIQADPADLNELYDIVSNMTTEGKAYEFGKAFHINAYNLLVIKQVTLFYPISSPFDVNGFFDNIKHEVCKEDMTLDELEKELILPTYEDPRIHFALVCAAHGCPPLATKAYRPNILENQLEEKAKQMINDDSFVQVQNSQINISKIFEWYANEFTDGSNTVVDYLNQYRVTKIPDQVSVRYNEYDWSLNDFQN